LYRRRMEPWRLIAARQRADPRSITGDVVPHKAAMGRLPPATSTQSFLRLPQTRHPSSRAGTTGRTVADVASGFGLKSAVFWDATPCGSCKNQRFGGTQRLHHQGDKNR
jgi:hypothetical protein